MCISTMLRCPATAEFLLLPTIIITASGIGLNCLSNDILRKPTLKTFYKAMTDTNEGYVSSFTGVPLP